MKSNPDKYYLLASSSEKIKMETGDLEIYINTCEKLLGVNFRHRLTFDYRISGKCKNTSKKVTH